MRSQLYTVTFLITFLSYLASVSPDKITPIVVWHGMGDSCCFAWSLGGFLKDLAKVLPGVYVVSLKIGSSVTADVKNGFFLHPDRQVQIACNTIKSDPKLRNGFNAIGFSQGAQFLRALVQRCDAAKVKNLISLGGQHQGVYGLPNCPSISSQTCDTLRKLLNHAAYTSIVQRAFVQATYWHDPLNEGLYIEHSTFLADINNERRINQTYISKLVSLENFVMVRFEKDTMVQPIASEWFEFYTPGQATEIMPLNKSAVYDRLGLRTMDSHKKLHFLTANGGHLQIDWDWFVQNIVQKFLM